MTTSTKVRPPVPGALRPPTLEELPESWRPAPPALMPANIADGWQDGAWRTWPMPDSMVRGESHYAAALRQLTGPPRPQGYLVPVVVVLRPEHTNPYDHNAVSVEVDGQIVGHIAREVAPVISEAMRDLSLQSCAIAGLLRGGYLSDRHDHRNVGVLVWPTIRLTPGPSFQVAGPGFLHDRRWPPNDDEGRD